jgi:hypothetical protein
MTTEPDPADLAARERYWRVNRLPPRIAEVTLALVEAWAEEGGVAPVATRHVWKHDSRALTVGSTSSALLRAMPFGLAKHHGRGQWCATDSAVEIRGELEARVRGKEGNDA